MPKDLMTDEWCSECDTTSLIRATVHPIPKCKRCKRELVPCSACTMEKGCDGCERGSKFVLHHDFK